MAASSTINPGFTINHEFYSSHLHRVNLLLHLVARNKVVQLLGGSDSLRVGSKAEDFESRIVPADQGRKAEGGRQYVEE